MSLKLEKLGERVKSDFRGYDWLERHVRFAEAEESNKEFEIEFIFYAIYNPKLQTKILVVCVENISFNFFDGVIEFLKRNLDKYEERTKAVYSVEGSTGVFYPESMVVSNLVYVYCYKIDINLISIKETFRKHEKQVAIIDETTWLSAMSNKKVDFFLSHDSRDKDTYAVPLYNALTKLGYKVWLDKFSLTVGSDVLGTLDEGLTDCRHGVLLVSDKFLQNENWAKHEMSTLINRAFSERTKSVLPVWINVNYSLVAKRSSILANIFAIDWSEGVSSVAKKLAEIRDFEYESEDEFY